ncbi:MAG: radical SAM protein, partial [Lachnospiraceae bacterium]|nr:radical SAM protein [Lachnospiraceae bacterium]
VRHLVLPGQKEDSKKIVRYLYETYHDSIYISLMNQYTPGKNLKKYPELQRKTTTYEYRQVVDYALSLGVTRGFMQEGATASESFIPDFDNTGVSEAAHRKE